MDPYKILKVSKKDSIEKIRNAFKKVARNVHPDKGGTEEMFNIVVEAYREIFKLKKQEESGKNFNELKEDSKRYTTEQRSTRNVHFADQKFDEDFQTKFNKIFDDNRLTDVNDEGYGSFMAPSSAMREDINIDKIVDNQKELHKTFDDQKAMNAELVKYKEPEALCVQSKKLTYDEIGADKIDDYSSDTMQKLKYTDYMKAHTTNKLIDKSLLKKHETYKNMDDIEKRRSNQSFEINEDDRKVIEQQEMKLKMKEARRQQILRERDEKSRMQFERINKLMLS